MPTTSDTEHSAWPGRRPDLETTPAYSSVLLGDLLRPSQQPADWTYSYHPPSMSTPGRSTPRSARSCPFKILYATGLFSLAGIIAFAIANSVWPDHTQGSAPGSQVSQGGSTAGGDTSLDGMQSKRGDEEGRVHARDWATAVSAASEDVIAETPLAVGNPTTPTTVVITPTLDPRATNTSLTAVPDDERTRWPICGS